MGDGTVAITAELEGLIEATVDIPTMPATLAEIDRIAASEDASARDAWRIIERDPPLAAQVLRLVNSSTRGVKQQVNTIQVACSLAGLAAIKHIVVRATVLQVLANGTHKNVQGMNLAWLWDHSFKTALAAQLLAGSVPWSLGMSADDAYTCGLVHDIGKVLLLERRPEHLARALAVSQRTRLPLAKVEMDLFGFTHAHLAGLLLRRWNLAPVLQTAVMHHHGASEDPEAWVHGFLLHAANGLAHEVARGSGGWIGDPCDHDAMQLLGISEEKLRDIRNTVRSVAAAP